MHQTDTGKAHNLETGTAPACRELTHSKDPLTFLSSYANEAWKGKVLAQDHPVDKPTGRVGIHPPVSPDSYSSSATLAPESAGL